MAQINTRIVLRNDSLENWEAHSDVVLLKGEVAIAFCTDGTEKIKIGDGVSPWSDLKWFGGSMSISADGKSVALNENNEVTLFGFDAAEAGAYPVKKADGTIGWVLPTGGSVEDLQKAVAELQGEVTELQNIVTPTEEGSVPLLDRIETLEEALGGTGEGSVEAKIDEKLESFATSLTDDGKVNTLMEVIKYVEEHGAEAADMAGQITSLEQLVGEIPVSEQVANAVAESEAKAAELFEQTKYELTSYPAKARVSYADKEIRLMCAADTEWALRESGANADPNMYYVGFKAYAPVGAVSFKEDLAETISDETMYYFTGNDFAGTDEYGRKYSIAWLPVARYAPEEDKWTYYGASSTKSKYAGWYYTVEWYDAAGVVISSDTVRINLSNEETHNYIEPFYMGKVVKGMSVNGTLLEAVNNYLEMSTGDIVKDSEEIVANEDGSLGLTAVPVSKLVNDDGSSLILNGGGAQ